MKITKQAAIGFILGATIASISTAFAADTLKSAYFNNLIKVEVNGKQISSTPVTIETIGSQYARTYVPVRDVVEAMGGKVRWEDNTKTVIITSKEILQDSAVTFINSKIEQRVRTMLNIPEGEIYESDIDSIKTFSYSPQDGDPSDIGKFINLEELSIGGSDCLTDTTFLEKLKNLRVLKLNLATIKNFSVPDNLQELRSTFSSIENINSLKNLRNLKILEMNGLRIGTDENFFSGDLLSNLTGLEELSVSQYDSDQIKTAENLKRLINLKSLRIMYGSFTDISSIGELKGLEKLSLEFWNSDQIINIKPLENLKNLKELSLAGLHINNISPLSSLVKLEELHLGDNQIEDISPLRDLVHLNSLNIGYNKISDISTLLTIAENGGFKSNGEIDISSNRLDLAEGSQNMKDVQKLINKNIKVTYRETDDK